MPGMSTPKAHAQGAREEGAFFFGALCLAHWHGDLSSTPSPSPAGLVLWIETKAKKSRWQGGKRGKPRRKGRGGGIGGNARAFNGGTPY